MALRKLRWCSTVLQIKDPSASLKFYTENFGMKLVETRVSVEQAATEYSLVIPRLPSTSEGSNLINTTETALTLLHRHGSEKDPKFKVSSGNEEPYKSFGHIAFNCPDVYEAHKTLLDNGVVFKKGPDDGVMKGIAFLFDPDGYWIELVKREMKDKVDFPSPYNLSQTMIRVKDHQKSLAFYCDVLGMKLADQIKLNSFSLYFLTASEEEGNYTSLWHPVLELTHNHGTENDDTVSKLNAVEPPAGFKRLVMSTSSQKNEARVLLESSGCEVREDRVGFQVRDPDNYLIHILVTPI